MFLISDYEVKYASKILLRIDNLQMIQQGHVIICGEIGSGKSTFAKSLIGFKEFSGEIRFNEQVVAAKIPNNNISYVPQNLEYYFIMSSVFEEIVFASSIPEEQVDDLLAKYNLTHVKKSSPHVLSGGEKVRLVSLLNEINNAKCLILDETIAMNDYTNTNLISNEVDHIIADGSLVIEISHDITRIRKADQIFFIHQQQMVEFKNFNSFITNQHVKHVWGIDHD